MKTIELSNRRQGILRVAFFTMLSAAVHAMGEQVAFVSDQASPWSNWDIYLRDLASGVTTRLTTDPAIDSHPESTRL
jgi:hypothetical protein